MVSLQILLIIKGKVIMKNITKVMHLMLIFNILYGQFPNMEDSFSELDGNLSMYFFNALTGKPVKDAKVTLKGIGTYTSDHNGKIQFAAPNDPFANIPVTITKSGYVKTDFFLELKAGTIILNRFSISPDIPIRHVRMVLDWGKSPRDLDAHFEKKNSYHISYRNRKRTKDGTAMLDRDDTNGFGPETITVTSLDYNGSYEYRIKDYSNRNRKSDQLSKSGAEVKVYAKGKMMHHFKVPSNMKGSTWTVFKIKNSKIISINKLSSN